MFFVFLILFSFLVSPGVGANEEHRKSCSETHLLGPSFILGVALAFRWLKRTSVDDPAQLAKRRRVWKNKGKRRRNRVAGVEAGHSTYARERERERKISYVPISSCFECPRGRTRGREGQAEKETERQVGKEGKRERHVDLTLSCTRFSRRRPRHSNIAAPRKGLARCRTGAEESLSRLSLSRSGREYCEER